MGGAVRVTFAGVGEAFDEDLANTSILVETDATSLLLDCGFTAATAFWRTAKEPLDLDGIYITHFHGDHYFGIPALLIRFVEEGRTTPLTIMGQHGVAKQVQSMVDMAYPNTLAKAQFDISFLTCEPGQEVRLGDMRLTFAMNDHPIPSQSVRVNVDNKSVFYSGDGRPTTETLALARGSDLIIHESFSLEPDTPGHGTVDSSIQFTRDAGAPALALVHVQRMIRRNHRPEINLKMKQATGVKVLLPNPGDMVSL